MNRFIIQETEFLKARNKIREAQKEKKEIIFSGKGDDLNRKVLEKEKINVLLLPLAGRKDWMKQRNSGFNRELFNEQDKNKKPCHT